MSLTESNPTHSFRRERLTWSWPAFEGFYRHIGPIPGAQVPKSHRFTLSSAAQGRATAGAIADCKSVYSEAQPGRGLLELDDPTHGSVIQERRNFGAWIGA
jgi:hypothetical protein